MSHPLLPKNLNKNNALFRQGKPDYTKLAVDAFPTPTLDEAGTILENSDTGDRFRWTGTVWVQVNVVGTASVSDFWAEVGKRNIKGHDFFGATYSNEAVGATFTDLWGGAANLVFPTAAESWEIVSDDVNDTAAGTGARTVLVPYLDDSFEEQSIIATMNGTTPVALNADHFRTYYRRALVLTSGSVSSTDSNAGKITIQVAGGGAERGIIPVGNGVSLDSQTTVPANKILIARQVVPILPKNVDGQIRVMFRDNKVTDGAWFSNGPLPIYQNASPIHILAMPFIDEKLDFVAQATVVSAPDAVTEILEFVIVDKNLTDNR